MLEPHSFRESVEIPENILPRTTPWSGSIRRRLQARCEPGPSAFFPYAIANFHLIIEPVQLVGAPCQSLPYPGRSGETLPARPELPKRLNRSEKARYPPPLGRQSVAFRRKVNETGGHHSIQPPMLNHRIRIGSQVGNRNTCGAGSNEMYQHSDRERVLDGVVERHIQKPEADERQYRHHARFKWNLTPKRDVKTGEIKQESQTR